MHGKRPWLVVSLFCAVCVALIMLLWRHEVRNYRPTVEQLTSEADWKEALKLAPASNHRLLVPTGVFILSFDFVKANEANLTGYVWQRHRLDQLAAGDDPATHGKVRAGVLFPEQVDSSSTQLQESYRREQTNAAGEREVVIGWYFDVTVRQHFDYAKYPLDRHDLWLRLWPMDFDEDVVLVPDLAAYDGTARGEVFGIDRDIVPGTWAIRDTFFSYKRKCYDTRFGLQSYEGQYNFPELHYNITLSRRFEDAFIVALVPLISVLVLLFSVLVLATEDRERASIFGFNAAGAIGASSALLFVVMLAHVSLRREFATTQFVYLEYFYLVTYLAVLGVSVNVYLFSAQHHGRLLDRLHRDDDLVPKLLFWPLVLVLLSAATLVVFGPSAWSGSEDRLADPNQVVLCKPEAAGAKQSR